MIEEVREEWMEMARVPEAMATKRQKISICCLGEVPVLNSILRIQLGELGYRRFSETTRLEPGSHELDPAMVWLKLSEFTGTLLKGTILDWSSDMRRFLKPLKRFVDLQTLDLSGTITSSPLMRSSWKNKAWTFCDVKRNWKVNANWQTTVCCFILRRKKS